MAVEEQVFFDYSRTVLVCTCRICLSKTFTMQFSCCPFICLRNESHIVDYISNGLKSVLKLSSAFCSPNANPHMVCFSKERDVHMKEKCKRGFAFIVTQIACQYGKVMSCSLCLSHYSQHFNLAQIPLCIRTHTGTDANRLGYEFSQVYQAQ